MLLNPAFASSYAFCAADSALTASSYAVFAASSLAFAVFAALDKLARYASAAVFTSCAAFW